MPSLLLKRFTTVDKKKSTLDPQRRKNLRSIRVEKIYAYPDLLRRTNTAEDLKTETYINISFNRNTDTALVVVHRGRAGL